jgi:hypothetical protein
MQWAGNSCPPYDSRATLEELAGLVRKYAVETDLSA